MHPKSWLTGLTLAASFMVRSLSAQPVSLEHAHAHNDYEHDRPLLGALELGFNSIEADVYLVRGQLLVAHSKDSVQSGRTLESLYLAPLRAFIREHGGRAITGTSPLILLIDIKSDAESTYVALDSVLRKYDDIFTAYDARGVTQRAVVAVLSGNRAIATVRKAPSRFAALDGRLTDLDVNVAPPGVMPLISDNWERITKWQGVGPIPSGVAQEVERVVHVAHARGQQVRFWNTADNPAIWNVLLAAGVDLIGADDLSGLGRFLTGRHASP